jgi:hypothetical protein
MKLGPRIRLLAGAGFALALTAVALVPASGTQTPAASAQPSSGTFVGKIGNTNSVIAVVMIGGGVTASVYVTNGIDQAEWFRGATALPTGQILSNVLEMRSRSGAVVTMEPATGGGPRGKFRFPDGTIHDFTTAPALGVSGVYRGEARMGESTLVAGWIVSDQTSVVGAMLQRADFDTPDIVHPLLPGSLDPIGMRGTIPLAGVIEVRRIGDQN